MGKANASGTFETAKSVYTLQSILHFFVINQMAGGIIYIVFVKR